MTTKQFMHCGMGLALRQRGHSSYPQLDTPICLGHVCDLSETLPFKLHIGHGQWCIIHEWTSGTYMKVSFLVYHWRMRSEWNDSWKLQWNPGWWWIVPTTETSNPGTENWRGSGVIDAAKIAGMHRWIDFPTTFMKILVNRAYWCIMVLLLEFKSACPQNRLTVAWFYFQCMFVTKH